MVLGHFSLSLGSKEQLAAPVQGQGWLEWSRPQGAVGSHLGPGPFTALGCTVVGQAGEVGVNPP